MNSSQSLRDVENSVRSLITYKLSRLFGDKWLIKSGISEDKIKKWEERRGEDLKRLGTVDNRILYYADFYDLPTILKKHWDTCFAEVLGKWKEFEVLWGLLEGFRNPDAHRRELLPFQVSLIDGIKGKIRTDITSYFSKMDTGESYFPRLESIQDSLGNSWSNGVLSIPSMLGKTVRTGRTLRPGDIIQFTVSAFDPLGEELEYGLMVNISTKPDMWSNNNLFELNISEEHISQTFNVSLVIRSTRQYHATQIWDDIVTFRYAVLPI